MARWLFGAILILVGLLYLWLAFKAVEPLLQDGDWVGYLGAALFLAAAIAATLAGTNLLRSKRR